MVLVVPWKGCYLVLSWPTTFNLIFFFFHSSWLNEKENRFLHSVKQGGWRNSPSGTLHFDSSAHPCQNMLIEGKKIPTCPFDTIWSNEYIVIWFSIFLLINWPIMCHIAYCFALLGKPYNSPMLSYAASIHLQVAWTPWRRPSCWLI